ncbi:hypothetical protein PVAG01_04863 [Phlyctema vagabunda]|uniref:Uncharacterized protein n=1 Tax=Phlyctema vagabunda TaxID=108571 RepID=A0ABR4PIF9_9HELO
MAEQAEPSPVRAKCVSTPSSNNTPASPSGRRPMKTQSSEQISLQILPAEIRLSIFEYALANTWYPAEGAYSDEICATHRQRMMRQPRMPALISAVRRNKILYHEALCAFTYTNTFHCRNLFFPSQMDRRIVGSIKHLEITVCPGENQGFWDNIKSRMLDPTKFKEQYPEYPLHPVSINWLRLKSVHYHKQIALGGQVDIVVVLVLLISARAMRQTSADDLIVSLKVPARDNGPPGNVMISFTVKVISKSISVSWDILMLDETHWNDTTSRIVLNTFAQFLKWKFGTAQPRLESVSTGVFDVWFWSL